MDQFFEETSPEEADDDPNYVQCLDDLNATRLAFQQVTYVFNETTMETAVHFTPTTRTEELSSAIEDCFVRNNVFWTQESIFNLLELAIEKASLFSEIVTLNIQAYTLCLGNDAIPETDKSQFSLETIQDAALQHALMEKAIEALTENLQSLSQ